MEKFSTRIRKLRKQYGFTQKQLGEAIGGDVSTYQNYEYNKAEPSVETLVVLADIFHVSIGYLLGRENNDEKIMSDPSLTSLGFGERLRVLRKKNGYTLEQMAKAVNRTTRMYCYYESGGGYPTLQGVLNLADLLHVSIDDLIGQ